VVTLSIATFARKVAKNRAQPIKRKRWRRPGQGTFDD
jgi:hypothetical protein